MRDRVQQAERHDARTGRRVGPHDEAIKSAVFLREPRTKERGAQVAGGADLQRNFALLDRSGIAVGPPLMRLSV